MKSSGSTGQEILDADGRIIAWTTDEWLAQVIVKLLNENEGLLHENEGLLRGDLGNERKGDK